MGRLGFTSQLTQPILPKFGGFFCLCTTGPPKYPMTGFCFWQFYVPIICVYDRLSLDLLELFFYPS